MINFYSFTEEDINKKILLALKIAFFSILNLMVFNFVYTNANILNTFEDEIISLASNYNFFTSLNFDARPLIPKNYGVGLTSGPLSAIGGVLGWGLSKSFLVARVSNFYYVFLLQIIFSYFLAKQYKLNLKNLIIFSSIQILLVPWWIGSLYSIGEVASTIIFVNSLFLFSKNKNLSLILFGSCVIYGKFLLILPFTAFYISNLFMSKLDQKKIISVFKDFFIFTVPFFIWYALIILKSGLNNFLLYINEFVGFIFYYEDSGFESARQFSLNLILNQIQESEVPDWSSASLLRICIVPILFGMIVYRNKEQIHHKFEVKIIPILFSVYSTYLWFWLLSPTKYIRHTKHFTIIIIFILFYSLIAEAVNSDFDKLIITSIISLFFSDIVLILIFNILIYSLFFIKLNKKTKNFMMNILFSGFLILNLGIGLNESNTKERVDLNFPACADGLTLEKCFSSYLYYDIYTGEKK